MSRPEATACASFQLDGGSQWFTHDVGWFPVVHGPAEVVLNGRRTLTGTLAATIRPDDRTMPAPGECETGITFVFVDGPRHGADTMLSSAGEICSHHPQPPTSIITHTFTGPATIEQSDHRRLERQEAFLDIRMADNGQANVFATTR